MMKYKRIQSFYMIAVCVMLMVFGFNELLIKKVHADESSRSDNTTQRKRAQILSNTGYKAISAARKAMEEEQMDNALDTLTNFLSQGERVKAYDRAKAMELQVYIFMNKGEYTEAATVAEQTIALDSLDEYAVLDLHYRLVHLYSSLEKYENSISHLKRWFERAENPQAQAYFTAAQIYAITDQYQQALGYAEQGMNKHENNVEAVPKESWHRLLLAIYLELKGYESAVSLLEKMISHWPDRVQYFQQLSALYQELDKGKESLAVLSIAYQNALLVSSGDVERLAQMYRFHEYPYKAALVLHNAIEINRIEQSEKNWEHLSNAWLQAREWENAEKPLQQAAQMSSTGKHWFLLCQTAFQNEQWASSREYCLNAIDKGGLNADQGAAWQLVAMSHFYTNNSAQAIEAFNQCSKWQALANACTQWSQHVSALLKRSVEQAALAQQERVSRQTRQQRQQERVNHALQF